LTLLGREFCIHERHGLPVAIKRQHIEMRLRRRRKRIVIHKILAIR
jgi:hypothetical protein